MGLNAGLIQVGHMISPNALTSVDWNDPQALLEAVKALKPLDYILVLAAHVIAVWVGMWAAFAIGKKSKAPKVGIIVVCVWHLLGAIYMLFLIPSPIWFAILDVTLPIVGMLYLIGKTRKKR